MDIAIIGCGLIGKKRLQAFSIDDNLVACCDTNLELAIEFSKNNNCIYYTDPFKLIIEIKCHIIIVAVVNKYAHDICIMALQKGVNVLVEKPLGINEREAFNMLNVSKVNKVVLKTGFNHRFHPSILKAKKLMNEFIIGDLLYITAQYGHGSRVGMKKEWRSSKELCGGGELLDQGVHIIDLARWFAGEIISVYGKTKTKFWDIEVEDNAFVLLESITGVDIQFHVSWTNWKNTFRFDMFGSKGYIKLNGLGGSYGLEELELGIRNIESGPPTIQRFEFNNNDTSWKEEWVEFKNSIIENREPIGSGFDGYKANEIVKYIYESSIASLPINLIEKF